MTDTSLDFSRRSELALHGRIVAAVTAVAGPLGIELLIVGAFARDLHLTYAYGIETQRQTEDVDLGLAVPEWTAFHALEEQLVASGAFRRSATAAHRLRYQDGLPVDLVPFGRVETGDRKIAWPPRGDIVMDVFGFREAHATAHEVLLPGPALTHVVSLAALALLKIVCWHDRHYESPRKDAHDLQLILRNYLLAGNEPRLWGEFVDWTQEDAFDYELAGARMLGHDVRQLLDDEGIKRVGGLLSEQADPDTPAILPAEMNPHDPDRARALLDAMLGGIMERWRK